MIRASLFGTKDVPREDAGMTAVKSGALGAEAKAAPLPVAPGCAIRKVAFDAPYGWLAAGWRDLWRVPAVSLTYGAIFAAVGAFLALGLTQTGLQSLVLVLAAGFALVGPMLAAGLYETSRRLEKGEPVSFASTLRSAFLERGQLPYMGLFLALIYLAWVETALLLFMLFFGPEPMPPLRTFLSNLLLTDRGLGLLIVGTAVGAVLAVTVFAISVVSVPLLMVKRIDVVTASLTSISACRENVSAMALWAALIAAAMLLGFGTLFAGLIVTFPLIGHATWHAFRDVVEYSGES
jgi:uncharacterized membrane protein